MLVLFIVVKGIIGGGNDSTPDVNYDVDVNTTDEQPVDDGMTEPTDGTLDDTTDETTDGTDMTDDVDSTDNTLDTDSEDTGDDTGMNQDDSTGDEVASTSDSEFSVDDSVFDDAITVDKKEVDLKHGKSYAYKSNTLDIVLLNDDVQIFKSIELEDTSETVSPDKGNVFLGVFLSVKNNSDEDIQALSTLMEGYYSGKKNKNKNASITFTAVDDLNGYSIDDNIKAGETKKICLLYEVPSGVQEFYLKTVSDNVTVFNIDLKYKEIKDSDTKKTTKTKKKTTKVTKKNSSKKNKSK